MKGFCNGCGDCCRVVVLSALTVESILSGDGTAVAPGASDSERVTRWVRDELKPISYAEAIRRRPLLAKVLSKHDGTYSCVNFNEADNTCNDYANRPSICSGFPWYGKDPKIYGKERLDDLPNCGYKVDLEEVI